MPAESIRGRNYHELGCTHLNDVAYRAEVHHTGDIVYAGYRIVMVPGHEYDDGLSNINV